MECLEFLCSQTFWSAAGTIALIITLIYIVKYTRATRDMAKSTKLMAEVQSLELGLNKKPVIVIGCTNDKIGDFPFRTWIHNKSNVHGKCKVLVHIEINGKVLELPKDHHYSGNRIWELQAGTEFFGHLDMARVIDNNKIKEVVLSKVQARITFQIWAINHLNNNSELDMSENKNPIVQWYWDYNHQVWVPEVDPELS